MPRRPAKPSRTSPSPRPEKGHGTRAAQAPRVDLAPVADPGHRLVQLELAVWREACLHLDIEESLARMLPVLARFLPVEGIAALGIDLGHRQLTALACAGTAIEGVPRGKTALSGAALDALFAFLAQRASITTRAPLALDALTPASDGRVHLLPLAGDEGPIGVLVLASHRALDGHEHAALRALRSPFAVALANDRRLHELARLREAALAENQALLTRLSRQSIVESIVGERGGLRAVMERVAQVASTDVPVLLLGETGSGKEVVARALHERSRRHAGPMVRVNCGAIPSELIDSELFGHERGSFTGAVATKKGWFERADGGTLLLDEVGELPLAAQVRLLRIVQEGTLERVGGQRTLSVDVRIVAATHRDLHAMVDDGSFREDLWYRLSVFPLRLPSLRERREDIPALAAHFAARAGTRLGAGPLTPSREDLDLLLAYPWPGNVRELASVIERATILGHGRKLEVGAALGATYPSQQSAPLAPEPALARAPDPSPALGPSFAPSLGSPSRLEDAMRDHIEQALRASHGRIEGPKGAALQLGINPHTLRSRMRKLGIAWSRYR